MKNDHERKNEREMKMGNENCIINRMRRHEGENAQNAQ